MLNEKVYCHKCKQATNHKDLYKHVEKSDVYDDFQWSKIHYIAQCSGCDYITFVREYSDEDYIRDTDDGDYEWYSDFTVYPEAPKTEEEKNPYVLTAKQFLNVPDFLVTLYEQVVEVANLDFTLLCAAGLRTIIEAICKEIILGSNPNKRTNLEEKINDLMEERYITQKQADVLHQIRKLGNNAVHKIEIPKRRAIRQAIEVVEHVLTNIYEFEKYRIAD